MLLLTLVECVVLVGYVLLLPVVGFLRLLVASVRVGAKLVLASSWSLFVDSSCTVLGASWCLVLGARVVLKSSLPY